MFGNIWAIPVEIASNGKEKFSKCEINIVKALKAFQVNISSQCIHEAAKLFMFIGNRR